jgi:hypothetical protein
MKRASECTILALLICINPLAVRARGTDRDDIERLLDAIAQVESRNHSHAVGDGGQAIGMYQLHRGYWRDGTRILRVKWDYSLALKAEKSRQVVKAYLLYYGKGKSLLDMARIHNGGPNGHKKKATLPYARKIAEILCKDIHGEDSAILTN